jgi:hypothetical protein
MPERVAKIPTVAPATLHGIPWDRLRAGVMAHVPRYVKVNRKCLSRANMQYLEQLYDERNNPQAGWVKVSRRRIKAKLNASDEVPMEGEVQTGDYALLILWGLAEKQAGKRGVVRITPWGEAFIEGRTLVHEAAFIENYRNNLVCFDGKPVSYGEVRARSFDEKAL